MLRDMAVGQLQIQGHGTLVAVGCVAGGHPDGRHARYVYSKLRRLSHSAPDRASLPVHGRIAALDGYAMFYY